MKSKRVRDVVSRMPALHHHPDKDAPFNQRDSEVINWLVAQPEVRVWLMDTCREAGLIRFFVESGTWKGVDS